MSYQDAKRFNEGDIVYFVDKRYGSARLAIKFGVVIDYYSGFAMVRLYTMKDTRTVNGIKVNDFKTPTKWQKLPKGWTYNTELFKMGNDPSTLPNIHYDYYDIWYDLNKDAIREAIDTGWLIPVEAYDQCKFETEIDKNKGWRIIRKYPTMVVNFSDMRRDVLLEPDKVYETVEEAEAVVKAYEQELIRQSNLSDYDWSVEQIDHTLNRWIEFCHIEDERPEKYREWLLNKKNVEDIEIRFFDNDIQWKYWKNKKWFNIEL